MTSRTEQREIKQLLKDAITEAILEQSKWIVYDNFLNQMGQSEGHIEKQ